MALAEKMCFVSCWNWPFKKKFQTLEPVIVKCSIRSRVVQIKASCHMHKEGVALHLLFNKFTEDILIYSNACRVGVT